MKALSTPKLNAGKAITQAQGHNIPGLRLGLHPRSTQCKRQSGFTLVEVLLALAVIAIALTALLMAIAQNVQNTQRIKEKTVSHWVAMQGVTMIQLNLLQINKSQETTQNTTMLGEHWYWRAKVSATAANSIQVITISVSQNISGPFREELQAFRYVS